MPESAQPTPGDFSPDIEERIRVAFQSVLDAAAPAYELGQLNLFHDEDETFLRKEVERMLYEPQLPNGGQKERRMIERLKKLSQETEWAGHDRARYAITQWQKVVAEDPKNSGRYYKRLPLSPRMDKVQFEWVNALKESAHSNKLWDKKWFAQMLLDGMPEAVSNFEMECLFLLRKSDGTVDRLVRLRNVLGEVSKGPHHKGSDILDAEAFAAPEKFRRWALAHGNFSWSGNQTDLHKLHEDNTHAAAWRVINRVDSVGWLKVGKSGIWFLGDCAYADGKPLSHDTDGIYWFNDEGYYLNNKGRETQFAQSTPKLRPDFELVADEKLQFRMEAGSPRNLELYKKFYVEICQKFYDTLGGYQGWLMLGALFAYGAAPEIFEEFGLFPGLFVHGEFQSGKTLVTSWAMHMWGFNMGSGIGLLKGSAVGLLCESENYSNLPIWVDEFRSSEINPEKEAVLRDSFNRQPTIKWSPDGSQRLMKTAFVVSGESTSRDSAMQSRFPHVQVSASKRVGNHLEWFNSHKDKFFIFGRTILERRAEFVTLLRGQLEDWLKAPQMAGVSEREKMVHGIDFAAWSAMTSLLGNPISSDGVSGFMSFMVEHAKGSALDIRSESNIMVFLTDVLTAFKAEAIPKECFRTEYEYVKHPPGRPNQNTGWKSYKLFIDPAQTISHVQNYLSKHRGQITLGRKDLQAQLSKLACWIEGKHVKRFGPSGDTSTIKCWGFDLDKMELGYQPCTDAEHDYFLMHADEGDPRMGPFYAIVFALEKRERDQTEAAR